MPLLTTSVGKFPAVGGGGFSPTSTESSNFIARTSGLSDGQKTNYDTLITGLVTDGIFSKLDALHVYCAPDSTTSLLNLISSSYNATTSGSPSFTANTGYAGGGTAKINTNFNASTAGGNYGSTNLSFFVYTFDSWTGIQDSGALFGYNTDSSQAVSLYPHFVDGNFYVNPQWTTGSNTAYVAGTHFAGVSRTATGPVTTLYQTTTGTSIGSGLTALVNDTFMVLGDNAVGFRPYNGTAAASVLGGYLTSTEEGNLYSRLSTYMTAVHGSA